MRWLIAGRAWQGISDFRQALAQLAGLRLNMEHHIPSMLTWRALLRGWPRPNEQHDASEFLIYLLGAGVRTTPLSQWLSVARRAGAVEIVELGAGVIYLDLPPGVEGGSSTLQNVLQAWHEQPCNRPGLQEPAHCVQGDETHVL